MSVGRRALAVLVPWLFLWGSSGLCATNATVTLQVTTEPTSGKFAPRHVLAIWIADAKGRHVRTLELYGNRMRKYLVEWNTAVAGNDKSPVDAVTGATLKVHKTHVVTWDCRDESGNPVPAGKYEAVVEFSEQNGKGPILRIKFNKSSRGQTVEPKAAKYFKDAKLTYLPQADTGNKK